jgi:Family of unknown function (DUF6519)/Multicopper oxidase
MKGDFTRSTFDKKKHYHKVNMQQGKVQVDADWNEQNDIQSHHERTFLRDIVGRSGTLEQDNGFKISENFLFTWDAGYPDAAEAKELGSFLRDSFGLLWIEENPSVIKSADGNTLTVSALDASHSATITRGAGNPPVLAIDGKPVYEFLHSGNDLWSRGYVIGKGDYYVDGILCENERDVEASRQPDILAQQARFLIFEWESAGSDPVKNVIAGFVSGIFPAMAGALTVEKTSNTLITITNSSTSATATIDLKGAGKALLKSGTSEVPLATELSDDKTLIYYQVENPSLPTTKPSAPTSYFAYLDVWDQHVTQIEDPYIREKALGGVDTSTRTRIAWQVRLLQVGSSTIDSCSAWGAVDNLGKLDLGRMQARPKPTKEQTEMCKLYETAGYYGLENHLYRVEVHRGGGFAESTFKWSRDNGVVVSTVTKFRDLENKIEIQSRGRDDNLDFKQDTWIEITDELHERFGLPGTMVKVKEVKENIIEYYPDKVIGHPLIESNFTKNPKARRWDSDGVLKPANATDYIELENGVEIRLGEGHYRTGDYWLVPARTNSEESIEWPKIGDKPTDAPQALLPAGVPHHYAPLAIIEHKTDGMFSIKLDTRSFFSSLTALVMMHYVGGDGQHALPTNKLPAPLRVSVTLGNQPISKTPMAGARIRFTILDQQLTPSGTLRALPAGSASNQLVDVSINTEGIAECEWTLGEGMEMQRVMAELYDDCGNKLNIPPIYFSATLNISFYYVEGDGVEASEGNEVSLKAGLSLGTSPLSANYLVRFTKEMGEGELLTSSPVKPDENGLVEAKLKVKGTTQVVAEVFYTDNSTAPLKKTTLQPIYFNVASLRIFPEDNDFRKFIEGRPDFILTNGVAYNYMPSIGEAIRLPLNENAEIFKVKPGELTRWYMANAGPRKQVFLHFPTFPIVNRLRVDTVTMSTLPPLSTSIIEKAFPQEGVYIEMDSDLGHFLKGSGFAVLSTGNSTADDHPRRSKIVDLPIVGHNRRLFLTAVRKRVPVVPNNPLRPGGADYNAIVLVGRTREEDSETPPLNESFPGPVVGVIQGDNLEVIIRNKTQQIISLIFSGLGPSASTGNIRPGEERGILLRCTTPGLFLYHGGGDGFNGIWEHVMNGMYGAIVVRDREQRPAKEFCVIFSELYSSEIKGLFE